MARIDYCDTSKSNERTREILGKNRNANIFRMMAHSPSYFEQYCRLGGAIRHRGELDPVVRELAITRTGILCEAPYEIVAHKRIGKNVGVTDEQNAALEDWKSATCFNEVQRAALAFTDEVVAMRRPTDATFNAIAAKLTPAALIELQLVRRFLHHDVEIPGDLRHRHAAGVGSDLNVRSSARRQQIHLGVGHDQPVGEQLRQIAHDPFAGPRMLLRENAGNRAAGFRGR